MFTAFSISSMPIRMATAFLRASTPYRPMQNSAAAKAKYQESGTMCISVATSNWQLKKLPITSYQLLFFPSDHNRSHQGNQEQHRRQLKWQRDLIRVYKAVAQSLRAVTANHL